MPSATTKSHKFLTHLSDQNPNSITVHISNNEAQIDRWELKELDVGTNLHYNRRRYDPHCRWCRWNSSDQRHGQRYRVWARPIAPKIEVQGSPSKDFAGRMFSRRWSTVRLIEIGKIESENKRVRARQWVREIGGNGDHVLEIIRS